MKLVCIRMTAKARAAVEHAMQPSVYLWQSELAGCGVWWDRGGTADGLVWRAWPPKTIERQVKGVTKRADGRWCWVL
jgi:hypothetical protein